jgi:hypothetical protein
MIRSLPLFVTALQDLIVEARGQAFLNNLLTQAKPNGALEKISLFSFTLGQLGQALPQAGSIDSKPPATSSSAAVSAGSLTDRARAAAKNKSPVPPHVPTGAKGLTLTDRVLAAKKTL